MYVLCLEAQTLANKQYNFKNILLRNKTIDSV